MPQIEKIQKEKIKRQAGFNYMDSMRDGKSTDIDTMMAAAIFITLIDKLNETIEYVNSMRLEIAALRQDVGNAIIKKATKRKGGKNV